MALPQKHIYTEEDYYNTPEDVRVELINGQFFYQAAPSRAHQQILGSLYATIHNYIKAKDGSCQVYPAPFAVKLNLYADAGVREYWIVNPMKRTVYVYHLEETQFETTAYGPDATVKVNILDDLSIVLKDIGL